MPALPARSCTRAARAAILVGRCAIAGEVQSWRSSSRCSCCRWRSGSRSGCATCWCSPIRSRPTCASGCCRRAGAVEPAPRAGTAVPRRRAAGRPLSARRGAALALPARRRSLLCAARVPRRVRHARLVAGARRRRHGGAALAGALFALSGYYVSQLSGNGSYAVGAAWIPWALAAHARARRARWRRVRPSPPSPPAWRSWCWAAIRRRPGSPARSWPAVARRRRRAPWAADRPRASRPPDRPRARDRGRRRRPGGAAGGGAARAGARSGARRPPRRRAAGRRVALLVPAAAAGRAGLARRVRPPITPRIGRSTRSTTKAPASPTSRGRPASTWASRRRSWRWRRSCARRPRAADVALGVAALALLVVALGRHAPLFALFPTGCRACGSSAIPRSTSCR